MTLSLFKLCDSCLLNNWMNRYCVSSYYTFVQLWNCDKIGHHSDLFTSALCLSIDHWRAADAPRLPHVKLACPSLLQAEGFPYEAFELIAYVYFSLCFDLCYFYQGNWWEQWFLPESITRSDLVPELICRTSRQCYTLYPRDVPLGFIEY